MKNLGFPCRAFVQNLKQAVLQKWNGQQSRSLINVVSLWA